jgi:chromosomal replication initiator protein
MEIYDTQLAPACLVSAMEKQRDLAPDDTEAIERLFEYLKRSRPTLLEIRDAVCEFYLIDCLEVHHVNPKGTRMKRFTFARQIFCYLAYRYTRHRMPRIGQCIGYRDHTTVWHGIHKIEKQAVTRPVVADDLDLLRLRIAEKILSRPNRDQVCEQLLRLEDGQC